MPLSFTGTFATLYEIVCNNAVLHCAKNKLVKFKTT